MSSLKHVRHPVIHQRNIIRIMIPLSAAFQSLVQEKDGMYAG